MNKVGFIGLGIMGRPMVNNLLKNKFEVYVNDINEQAVKEAVKNGGIEVSISDMAQKVDICQLVWLTKNTSYENVGGIFLRKNTIDS